MLLEEVTLRHGHVVHRVHPEVVRAVVATGQERRWEEKKKEDAKSLFQPRGKVPEIFGYVMARVGAAQIMRTSFEDSSITDSNRGHLPLRTARLAMGRTACILRSSDEKSWNMSTERTHYESRGKDLTKVRFCVFDRRRLLSRDARRTEWFEFYRHF